MVGQIRRRRRSAFTLIEVTAVILIMGLLASAAVLSLAHATDEARYRAQRTRLEQIDALVRSAARQSGRPQQLIFDLENNRVQWRDSQHATPATVVELPGGDMEIWIGKYHAKAGRAVVNFSPEGFSRSYLLAFDQGQDSRRWMLVSGLSGATSWKDDERNVRDAIRLLRGGPPSFDEELPAAPSPPARDDAH